MFDKYPSLLRPITLLVFLSAMIFLNGCGGNSPTPEPDPLEEQMKLLAGAWKLGTVKNDGVDVTGKYNGFTLLIAPAKTFTTTNGYNAWPASGSFTFPNNDPEVLSRNDGIEITINSLSTSSVELAFTKNTAGGRINGVTGQFIFSLVK